MTSNNLIKLLKCLVLFNQLKTNVDMLSQYNLKTVTATILVDRAFVYMKRIDIQVTCV